jgi:hypothetical protein
MNVPSTRWRFCLGHGDLPFWHERSRISPDAKDTLETESLSVVADRGYFNSAEILVCEEASITVTLPKPMTVMADEVGNLLGEPDRRDGKQDFRYVATNMVVATVPVGDDPQGWRRR